MVICVVRLVKWLNMKVVLHQILASNPLFLSAVVINRLISRIREKFSLIMMFAMIIFYVERAKKR